MPDIRAKLSDEAGRQLRALMDRHGFSRPSELIDFVVRIEYRRCGYLGDDGVYEAAADNLRRTLKIDRLSAAEIESVTFRRDRPVSVRTGHSGEPYLIKDWRI